MNAQQRRKAYRKIDRMIGKVFNYGPRNRPLVQVRVLGRTRPVEEMPASATIGYNFDGSRPSVHRAQCERTTRQPDGGLIKLAPRIRDLRPA